MGDAMEIEPVKPDVNGKSKVRERQVECLLTSSDSWISEDKLHTTAAEMLPSYWYSRSNIKEMIKVEDPDESEGESSSRMQPDIHHEKWTSPVVVKSEIHEEGDIFNNNNDVGIPLSTSTTLKSVTSKTTSKTTSSLKRDALLKILKYQCVKCKLNFDSYNSLDLHINSPLPCIDTVSTPPKKTFPSTKTLPSTKMLTSQRARHRCKVCNRCFSLISDLDEHMLLLHSKENMEHNFNGKDSDLEMSEGSHLEMLQAISEKEFQCHICGRGFYDDNSLQMHILIHNGLQTFTCPICGKSFSDKSYLKKHKLIHSIERSSPSQPMKSSVLSYETNTLYQSQSPILCFEKNNTLHQAQSSPDNKLYKCLTCGKEFAHKYYLTNHERSHKGEKPFFCEMCQERFSTKKDLEKHSLVHEKPYVCDLCYKRFTLSSVLQQHTLTEHSVEKLFFCDVCDKGFMRKDSLKLHKTRHHGTDINDVLKLYNNPHDDLSSPSMANKQVSSPSIVNKQVSSPSMVNKQVSSPSMVNKQVSSPSMINKQVTEKYDAIKQSDKQPDLEIHQPSPLTLLLTSPTMVNRRLNEDEITFTDSNNSSDNSFKCGTCEKSFSGYVLLHAHLRTHTSPRKKVFKCSLCSKAFVKRCDLKRHVMSHTGERPFPCDICHKAFTRNSHLKTHKMLHTGEKPFRCPVCDKGFIKRSDMRKHLNLHDVSKNTPPPEIIVL